MVGLDPQHARVVKDVLKERTRNGATIFLSTHQLGVAEEMADRIGIMFRGKLVAIGTANNCASRPAPKARWRMSSSLIGNDVAALVRTARELQRHPIAAIDLNLGCPAPVVYRKCAGGGLLRELNRIDAILGALREAVTVPFTVKTRLGFASCAEFDNLLALFARHEIDLLTVHGRTVAQMYRPGVRYDLIAQAARSLRCPVLANGNVHSAEQALAPSWPRPARAD
jgi:tRNA-dihydrouridine synthase